MASTLHGLKKEVQRLEQEYDKLKSAYDCALLEQKHMIERSRVENEQKIQREIHRLEQRQKAYIEQMRSDICRKYDDAIHQKTIEIESLKKKMDETRCELQDALNQLSAEINTLRTNIAQRQALQEQQADEAKKMLKKTIRELEGSSLPIEALHSTEFNNHASSLNSVTGYMQSGLYEAAIGIATVETINLHLLEQKTAERMQEIQEEYLRLSTQLQRFKSFVNSDAFKDDATLDGSLVVNEAFMNYWSEGWYRKSIELPLREIDSLIGKIENSESFGSFLTHHIGPNKDFTQVTELEQKMKEYTWDLMFLVDEVFHIRAFALANCYASSQRWRLTQEMVERLTSGGYRFTLRERRFKPAQESAPPELLAQEQRLLPQYDWRKGWSCLLSDEVAQKEVVLVYRPRFNVEKPDVQNEINLYVSSDRIGEESQQMEQFLDEVRRDSVLSRALSAPASFTVQSVENLLLVPQTTQAAIEQEQEHYEKKRAKERAELMKQLSL